MRHDFGPLWSPLFNWMIQEFLDFRIFEKCHPSFLERIDTFFKLRTYLQGLTPFDRHLKRHTCALKMAYSSDFFHYSSSKDRMGKSIAIPTFLKILDFPLDFQNSQSEIANFPQILKFLFCDVFPSTIPCLCNTWASDNRIYY